MRLEYINDELKLKYPCHWVYKIIGINAAKIHKAAAELIPKDDYKISFSNFSSKGKYICLNLEMTVENEAHRTRVYEALKKHADIKIVL